MLYDAIILGAGLVGLTQALLCAKEGLSVALVDRNAPVLEEKNESYDLRCFAISPGSQAIFNAIGVWDKISQNRLSAFEQMKVWDAEGCGEISFKASDLQEQNLGHIIENRVIVKALWSAIQEQTDIKRVMNVEPLHFSKEVDRITLTLNNQETLSAKVLVGADGADSWLRRSANLKTLGWDYQQVALVTVVKTEYPHEKTAWQRFLKEGPLAFLPLSDPFLSSIVWSTTPEKADELLAFSENDFCEALSFAFDYKLGKVLKTEKRQTFPLRAEQALRTIDERLVLIGDAAHVIHPLAGQGVNLGLQDAQVLSEVLSWAKTGSYDLGHYLVLRRYERARKGPVKLYLAGTDFLKRFFSLSSFPISCLRSVGVNWVNHRAWLKKQIMLQAMGISKPLY